MHTQNMHLKHPSTQPRTLLIDSLYEPIGGIVIRLLLLALEGGMCVAVFSCFARSDLDLRCSRAIEHTNDCNLTRSGVASNGRTSGEGVSARVGQTSSAPWLVHCPNDTRFDGALEAKEF